MLKEREYLAVSLFLCILFRDAGCDPLVVNTWAFTDATSAAWQVIESGGSGSEAVVRGCSVCEREQCDGTVGYGGSPDENGETTLDAMIMDGNTADAASVAGLREIKDAIAVARALMQHTKHTLLVGSLATDFAASMGFNRTDLHTNSSVQKYEEWKARNCQPNFWMNVTPDPSVSCGPYQPDSANSAAGRPKRKHNNTSLRKSKKRSNVDESNSTEKKRGPVNMRYDSHVDNHHHDTIGMIALDGDGGVTVGTSTNGANHKIPGRVGDSPIIGAGGYADSEVGGAVATGDGDVMMRFLPTFLAVELMRQGQSPDEACETAISRIVRHYPAFSGAVVAATKDGHVGAACHGFQTFPFSMASATTQGVEVHQVTCLK